MEKEADAQLFDVHAHHPEKTAAGAAHAFVASGFSAESNEEVLSYARAHGCFFSLGLGPQEIQRVEKYPDLQSGISEMERQAETAKKDAQLSRLFVAIGEVGLDKHWGKTVEERERQFLAFERMISLAGRLDLPLVIHSRDAEKECIQQLLGASQLRTAGGRPPLRVLMHCFGGKLEEAKRCADAGWLVSIPPQANSERKKIIKALPLSALVVESDAPYIGKMSADAMGAAEMIARYKEMKTEDVLRAASDNARKFFALPHLGKKL
ncbi:Tat-linked quality control protein TatD [uncultured archaeon]|nr:Tat-linked quality control protein TatD [uncultured archaeon]